MMIKKMVDALRAAHDTMLMSKTPMTHLRGYKMVKDALDEYDANPKCAEEALDPKEAFEAGFSCGRREQERRDFPDVGFRFNQDSDYYWDKYVNGYGEDE